MVLGLAPNPAHDITQDGNRCMCRSAHQGQPRRAATKVYLSQHHPLLSGAHHFTSSRRQKSGVGGFNAPEYAFARHAGRRITEERSAESILRVRHESVADPKAPGIVNIGTTCKLVRASVLGAN